jgi:hypothetical protein
MRASGVIVAALDCAHSAVEDWNRWYDLDHLPPNVGLPGILSGRRYVATPELSALRSGTDGSWWAERRSSFLTIYTLADDVMATFAAMVTLRDELDAAGRMFAEDLKAVRGGDGLALTAATGRPGLRCDAYELPFLGHQGLVVLRRADGGIDDGDHPQLASAVLGGDAGSALLSYASAVTPGTGLHVLLLEDAVAERAKAVADAVGGLPAAFSSAAYAAITPNDVSWADDLRAAGLPFL